MTKENLMNPPAAQIDELTGLLSRKAFLSTFDSELERLKGNSLPLSLAFADIDHFLEINEKYGHQVGDFVLKAVADTAREVLPENTLIGRYGGDEFILLFPGTERETVFLLMEKFRLSIAEMTISTMKENDEVKGVSISAGISCSPIDGSLRSEIMRKADQALYRAKISGRGRIKLATDERMLPKTSHYTQTQLERLTKLASERQAGEAELLREALDDLIAKYGVNEIER
jgi:diguanylate cyclase (GGDEF)-like protein